MTQPKAKISVVIPAFNEEKYVGACLRSVLRAATPDVAEIIVVDNGSTDRTAAVATSFPGVRVVRENRRSPSFARQRGYKASKHQIITFIDADCRVQPGWFEAVTSEFAKDPKLVCLSGPYLYKEQDLPALTHRVTAQIFWSVVAPLTYAITGFAVTGGNAAVRRSALDAIGGIDTRIAFYGDDTNLARRLHRVGTVKFRRSFGMYTSGRRISRTFLKTNFYYGLNYVTEAVLHRPATRDYDNVR